MFSKCNRYRRTKLLCEDGVASARQQAFVSRHESVCPRCVQEHALTRSALSALRAAVIEPQSDPSFESRFIRRWRVERRMRAVSYWMPAVAGAIVASVALLAVLQILFTSPARNDADMRNREASRGPAIPTYGEATNFETGR